MIKSLFKILYIFILFFSSIINCFSQKKENYTSLSYEEIEKRIDDPNTSQNEDSYLINLYINKSKSEKNNESLFYAYRYASKFYNPPISFKYADSALITGIKSKNKKLHVHHIIFRSQGGTNLPNNLITLCETCHQDLHKGLIDSKFKKVAIYKEPPFMNTLKLRLQNYYTDATFCYGYNTKEKRQEMQLPKSHINDAIAISFYNCDKITNLKYPEVNEYVIQVRIKKRSLHEQTSRKGIKEKNITQKRNCKNVFQVNQFKIGTKVSFVNQVGFISGFTGKSAYIKDINDNYITEDNKSYKQISLKKLNLICYNNGWVKFNHNSSLHLAKPDVGDFL